MFKPCKALALAGAMISLASAPALAQTQAPGGFVEVHGGKLWYETCGSGPQTLVLLHDGMLHSVVWDDVWPGLCRSFRVIRYDRRGYGRSPAAKAPYSKVDDLQAVMRAAGVRHAVIVGASNGGGIAIDFTLAHPDAVDRLVVVGPEVSGLVHSRHFIERGGELAGRMAKGDFMGALKGSWLLAPGDDANAVRLLKLAMASPQDLSHKDPATPPPPAAPRLGAIKAPTLVLIGEDDVADNQAQAGVVEYAVHGARRVVVRGAGHLVYLEQPATFTDIVTRFAAGAPSPGTEAALRRVIDEGRRGQIDYSRMSPLMAGLMRPQEGRAKTIMAALGPLRSLTFKATGSDGPDVFVAAFQHGSAEYRIMLGEGGRIDDLEYRPLR